MTTNIPVESNDSFTTISDFDAVDELEYKIQQKQDILDEHYTEYLTFKKTHSKLKNSKRLVAVKDQTKKTINNWIDWIFGVVSKLLKKLNKI
jgi:chromosome condensin MukBEF ATPase and DNA-binding subunit MukB